MITKVRKNQKLHNLILFEVLNNIKTEVNIYARNTRPDHQFDCCVSTTNKEQ